jgi:hypothetical protein
VENGAFQIPIEFVTMRSSIFTNLPKRCGRKPKTVVITLLEDDQESNQVFLDFAKNFKMADASAYALLRIGAERSSLTACWHSEALR